ncbi:hypothetical protein HanIR_Chr09g0437431 [Helianthus annuus]|nr:hypothetical protein HanIR_Chr09g0437431 [Helianthus annuus]
MSCFFSLCGCEPETRDLKLEEALRHDALPVPAVPFSQSKEHCWFRVSDTPVRVRVCQIHILNVWKWRYEYLGCPPLHSVCVCVCVYRGPLSYKSTNRTLCTL